MKSFKIDYGTYIVLAQIVIKTGPRFFLMQTIIKRTKLSTFLFGGNIL